ncbi:hypothetical protein BaRGS_00001757, partial [Batillaria attramentaria]
MQHDLHPCLKQKTTSRKTSRLALGHADDLTAFLADKILHGQTPRHIPILLAYSQVDATGHPPLDTANLPNRPFTLKMSAHSKISSPTSTVYRLILFHKSHVQVQRQRGSRQCAQQLLGRWSNMTSASRVTIHDRRKTSTQCGRALHLAIHKMPLRTDETLENKHIDLPLKDSVGIYHVQRFFESPPFDRKNRDTREPRSGESKGERQEARADANEPIHTFSDHEPCPAISEPLGLRAEPRDFLFSQTSACFNPEITRKTT